MGAPSVLEAKQARQNLARGLAKLLPATDTRLMPAVGVCCRVRGRHRSSARRRLDDISPALRLYTSSLQPLQGHTGELRVIAEEQRVGRCAILASSCAAGSLLLREWPVVRGTLMVDGGCAGCLGGRCQAGDGNQCRWPRVIAECRCQAAVAALEKMSRRVLANEKARGHDRSETHPWCLFALLIQAYADPPLWAWIQRELRPPRRGDQLPWTASLEREAEEFAGLLPARTDLGTGGLEWDAQVLDVIMRLANNFFEVGTRCLAIFPTAFVLEHACSPSVLVKTSPTCGRLFVRALRPLGAGTAASFCYYGGAFGNAPYEERQAALGFKCRCDLCKMEAPARTSRAHLRS